jgi:hypothetical protein
MELSGQLHAPATLTPEKDAAIPSLIGGWVGPRADMDVMEKR